MAPHYAADRLSALDAMFLGIESHSAHMHVGSISIFDGEPLRAPGGGIDMERLRRGMESVVSHTPRLRQKIERTPVIGHPVWVDDHRFNLHFHLRHTMLPPPGDDRQLKEVVGQVMSRSLDRHKPLWEMWFVDGLSGGRVAQITKVHHCMIDGAGGVSLMMAMLSLDDDPEPPAIKHWVASERPTGAQLLAAELAHRATFPLAALRMASSALGGSNGAKPSLRGAVEALGDLLQSGLSPASATALNGRIGAFRRFDWLITDLDRIKRIKSRLGGTVNDVVLACVAGAMRGFLIGRGEDVGSIDFRTAAPVNVRDAQNAKSARGNFVSSLIVPLPLDEPSALRRLALVREATERAKGAHQARGAELLEDLSDRIAPGLMVQIGRVVPLLRPCNTIVTNVPGPPFPLFLLGARLLDVYPYVPLMEHTSVAIALFSYCGRMFWGFNADWDELPDLDELVAAVAAELDVLEELSAAEAPPAPRRRTPRKAPPRRAGVNRSRAAASAVASRRSRGR